MPLPYLLSSSHPPISFSPLPYPLSLINDQFSHIPFPASPFIYPLSLISYSLYLIPYPLYLIPYPWYLIQYPLSLISYLLSLISYPLSLICYPLCSSPFSISLTPQKAYKVQKCKSLSQFVKFYHIELPIQLKIHRQQTTDSHLALFRKGQIRLG